MRTVDIPKFRDEVEQLVRSNSKHLTNITVVEDGAIIAFSGKHYTCEVTLRDNWIGYDLDIKTPTGMAGCGMENDTDLYPLKGKDEQMSLSIYHDLVCTLKALFEGHIYYTSNDRFSYTARKNEDGTYRVSYMERKKFLFLPYSSGWWEDKYGSADFEKLKLKVLR